LKDLSQRVLFNPPAEHLSPLTLFPFLFLEARDLNIFFKMEVCIWCRTATRRPVEKYSCLDSCIC